MSSSKPAATQDWGFVLNASNVVITTRDQRCSVDINNPTVHSMPSWKLINAVCNVNNLSIILNKPTVSHFGNTFKLNDLRDQVSLLVTTI